MIVLIKENLLKKLGIDLDALPKEFDKYSSSFEDSLTSEEKEFFTSKEYTNAFMLPFMLKDIVGTEHPSYENMTFLQAFFKSNRGDDIINKFLNNPGYYSETLKSSDQSQAPHDTPLELKRDSYGKCFIAGGNNRINLLMMIYLAELSKAKTEEEKDAVDKKYTFYAEVRSLPKNKDVYNAIFLLKDYYKDEIEFLFLGNNPDDCKYEVTINGEKRIITSLEELTSILKYAYNLSDCKNSLDLYFKIYFLTSSYITFKSQGNESKIRLLLQICPDLEQLKNLFIELRYISINSDVLDGINISQINYSNICEELTNIINKLKLTEEQNEVPSSPKM